MISRRTLIAAAASAPLIPAFSARAARAQEMIPPEKRKTPDEALELLREGNRVYVTGTPAERDKSEERRRALLPSQSPVAALVSCSDSRVPPELLFGRGLGEVFVIRNAGNTVDTAAMGSIEYAVAVLKVPLVVVLGHQRCGAVDAALSVVRKGTNYPGSIGRMIEPIIPAVLQAQQAGGPDLLEASVRRNVSRIVDRLRHASEPMLMTPIAEKRLRIVGSTYSLEKGEVDFFDLA